MYGVQAEQVGGSGQISIARGSTTPITANGLLATVTFQVVAGANGAAALNFTSGSAILRSSDSTNVMASSAGTTVTADSSGPTVSVSAPANNATVAVDGTTAITANVSDPGTGVAYVEFYVDNALVNTDNATPYSYNWSTSNLLGSHTIHARAFDNAGNNTVSGTNTVNVTDQTAPTVSLTAPSNNATVAHGTSVTLSANASDTRSTISRVEFLIDDAVVNTDTVSPYSYALSSLAVGAHTVKARATDAANNVTTSSTVNISVEDSTAPSVPANLRTTAITDTSIALAWNAATDNIGVTGYRIYRNGTLVTTTSSLAYNNTGLAIGTQYTYTVRAIDQAGNASAATTGLVVSTTSPYKPGDVNNDNLVNIYDLSILLANYSKAGDRTKGDMNSDGQITIQDLSLLLSAWGS